MAAIVPFPKWKKDAPTHERFYELAELARAHPEFFDKWVLVYCEDNTERFKVRLMEKTGNRTSECLGVLQAGIQELWDDTRRG